MMPGRIGMESSSTFKTFVNQTISIDISTPLNDTFGGFNMVQFPERKGAE